MSMLAGVALRLGGAGGKFVLLLVMAATLDPASVGVYGVVAATVLLGLYVVGLDYYTYTTRELLRADGPPPAVLVRDQIGLQVRSYLVSLALAPLVFATGFLPWRVAPWLLGILLVEHASLELYRLLVALKRPLRANLLFFVRSGSWSLAWSGLALAFPDLATLDTLFAAWLLGGVVAAAFGAVSARELLGAAFRETSSWHRIRSNLATAGRFLVATLAYRAILTVDRYALQGFRGASEVGVYTVYIGVATAVFLVVESGVVVSLFPGLVETLGRGDRPGFVRRARAFAGAVAGSALASALLVALAFPTLVTFLDRPEYAADLPAFWILLAATTIAVLGLVPHYVLYAMDRDREIMGASLAALAVALPAHLLLVPARGIEGAAWATLAAFLALTLGKGWLAVRALAAASPRRDGVSPRRAEPPGTR